MGDRATIVVIAGEDDSRDFNISGSCGVQIYSHWGGEDIVDIITKGIPALRQGDAPYSAARLCAVLCNNVPDTNLGVGLFGVNVDDFATRFQIMSPGDAGVVVYNCRTGNIQTFAGYLSDPDKEHLGGSPTPKFIGVPPK